jgi:hypothetical protein
MAGLSIYAKLVAAAIVALLIVAFGWHEYKAGETAGMAAVQQKWDRQTAAVSQATTVAVTAAASDALANYKAAGASAQQADEHKAQQAAVRADFKSQVQDYANHHDGANAGQDATGNAGCAAGLGADGLRIWNSANAAANGGGAVKPSDSAASVAQ